MNGNFVYYSQIKLLGILWCDVLLPFCVVFIIQYAKCLSLKAWAVHIYGIGEVAWRDDDNGHKYKWIRVIFERRTERAWEQKRDKYNQMPFKITTVHNFRHQHKTNPHIHITNPFFDGIEPVYVCVYARYYTAIHWYCSPGIRNARFI